MSSTMQQRVMVIQDALKKVNPEAIRRALTESSLQAGDVLLLLGVLDHVITPFGYKVKVNSKSILGVNPKMIAEEVTKRTEEYLSNEKITEIAERCENEQAGCDAKVVALEAATKLGATRVILDRQMNKDLQFFMDKLFCGISRVKRDNTIEKVREPVTSESTVIEQLREPMTSENTDIEKLREPSTSETMAIEQLRESRTSESTTIEQLREPRTSENTTIEQLKESRTSESTTTEQLIEPKTSEDMAIEQLRKPRTSPSTKKPEGQSSAHQDQGHGRNDETIPAQTKDASSCSKPPTPPETNLQNGYDVQLAGATPCYDNGNYRPYGGSSSSAQLMIFKASSSRSEYYDTATPMIPHAKNYFLKFGGVKNIEGNMTTSIAEYQNGGCTRVLPIEQQEQHMNDDDWMGKDTSDGPFVNYVCSYCNNRRPMLGLQRDFTYDELHAATDGFSSNKFISEGGFGSMYRGEINGLKIVVKQHKSASLQGEKEFMSEVLSKTRHENLVMLLGSCSEGNNRLLVYEYICNGSLDQHLSKNTNKPLSWEKRMKIAQGAAKGLLCLHENNIIHRDLRPSNILVTHEYEALLGDFGLATTLCEDSECFSETRVVGTVGYLAPEYAEGGKVSKKTDVYSFGIVMLQLITGLQTTDKILRGKGLVGWARPLLREKNCPDLIDRRILDSHDVPQLFWMVRIAEKCLAKDPEKRLSMDKVVYALNEIMKKSTRLGVEDFSTAQSDTASSTRDSNETQEDKENNDDDASMTFLVDTMSTSSFSQVSERTLPPPPVTIKQTRPQSELPEDLVGNLEFMQGQGNLISATKEQSESILRVEDGIRETKDELEAELAKVMAEEKRNQQEVQAYIQTLVAQKHALDLIISAEAELLIEFKAAQEAVEREEQAQLELNAAQADINAIEERSKGIKAAKEYCTAIRTEGESIKKKKHQLEEELAKVVLEERINQQEVKACIETLVRQKHKHKLSKSAEKDAKSDVDLQAAQEAIKETSKEIKAAKELNHALCTAGEAINNKKRELEAELMEVIEEERLIHEAVQDCIEKLIVQKHKLKLCKFVAANTLLG